MACDFRAGSGYLLGGGDEGNTCNIVGKSGISYVEQTKVNCNAVSKTLELKIVGFMSSSGVGACVEGCVGLHMRRK